LSTSREGAGRCLGCNGVMEWERFKVVMVGLWEKTMVFCFSSFDVFERSIYHLSDWRLGAIFPGITLNVSTIIKQSAMASGLSPLPSDACSVGNAATMIPSPNVGSILFDIVARHLVLSMRWQRSFSY